MKQATNILHDLYFSVYVPLLPTVSLVTVVSTFDIPKYTSTPGFGCNNEMLVGKEDTNTIIKYKFTDVYSVMWEKPVPEEMTVKCGKFIASSGKIILHRYMNATHLYSSELELESKHPIDKELSAISKERLLYKNEQDGKLTIDVYNMCHKHIPVHALRAPNDRKWSKYATQCIVPKSGVTVIADMGHKPWSLDLCAFNGMLHHWSLHGEMCLTNKAIFCA